jgi:hypothetical protein
MIDPDLATLYETETKKLKQQVERNVDRLAADFVLNFAMRKKNNWSQIVTG